MRWKITGKATGTDFGIFEGVDQDAAMEALAQSLVASEGLPLAQVKRLLREGSCTVVQVQPVAPANAASMEALAVRLRAILDTPPAPSVSAPRASTRPSEAGEPGTPEFEAEVVRKVGEALDKLRDIVTYAPGGWAALGKAGFGDEAGEVANRRLHNLLAAEDVRTNDALSVTTPDGARVLYVHVDDLTARFARAQS